MGGGGHQGWGGGYLRHLAAEARTAGKGQETTSRLCGAVTAARVIFVSLHQWRRPPLLDPDVRGDTSGSRPEREKGGTHPPPPSPPDSGRCRATALLQLFSRLRQRAGRS